MTDGTIKTYPILTTEKASSTSDPRRCGFPWGGSLSEGGGEAPRELAAPGGGLVVVALSAMAGTAAAARGVVADLSLKTKNLKHVHG